MVKIMFKNCLIFLKDYNYMTNEKNCWKAKFYDEIMCVMVYENFFSNVCM